jgi:hypothetical protein
MSSAEAASAVQAQAQTMANLIEQMQTPPLPSTNGGTGGTFQPDDFIVDTNGLWLEPTNEYPNLGLLLHNAVAGDNYQLLSSTNLLNTNWNLGQILFSVVSNEVDFSSIPPTNMATFYRAHQANPVMQIYDGQDSEEPNPTNTSNPGHAGIIYIQNEWNAATNDITVYYTVGGTAQNGIDYSNLTGIVTIPANQNQAQIDIDPIADGLKPNQTVILTLTQNPNYLIDPANDLATNTIQANPQVYPTASGDSLTPCPNTQWSVYLQATDPRGLPLTYTILTYPNHGTLTGTPPSMYYTATNCYEGEDDFTFEVSDGQYTSTPAAVYLNVSDPVYAYPVTAQTCRGTPVSFALAGVDNCSETLSYALLSNPSYGTLSNTPPNLTYTPNGTNFTGTDSFDYIVYNECGDSATNTATLTIGDEYVFGTAQTQITGTNQPLTLTLSAADSYDNCVTDTNYYTYAYSSPSNGVLSGTPPNLVYTPHNNFEGQDSFSFTVSDGAWTSSPAIITIDVTAGPILFQDCNPFSTAVLLDWMLDTNEQQMSLGIENFIVYRSTLSGGPYMAIATNNSINESYLDTNAVAGQTYYYVVTFQAVDSPSGLIVESPRSDKVQATAQNLNPLIPANAIWAVVTNLADPSSVTNLQAPFSSFGTNQYPDLYPLPNTLWPVGSTWSNHITMFIPSNSVPLAQVTYSIAIDNDYQLYLNNSDAPIETFDHENEATWAPYKSFEDVAPALLHYGTNEIGVVIVDEGGINYFSMIVSTNTCGM